MAAALRVSSAEIATPLWRRDAATLAARLPSLVVAARQVAQSVMHGVHGRRRAGPGETFWQFRPFISGEPAAAVDWRRSARDDRTYVREREWEAAHTVWIWIDRSPSMAFVSELAQASKIERATVLGLAAADLLVRGGERVGLIGLTRPLATRGVIERFAEAIALDERLSTVRAPLPPQIPLKARSKVVLISDFLSEEAAVRRAIDALSAQGAQGQALMIADPIEETFPFEGHTEFVGADGSARLRAPRAQSLREAYLAKLARHRDAVRDACAARGWGFALHRTDRPAAQALLALRMRLEGPGVAGPGASLSPGGA
ncbi:DUF58 domain-containing protein [Methylocapsa sp. S129]|uniref:DUF58 domain-containing protein n=1 Tax=Methylocapsa sp. S129 TaxID=1641869 RepID=UPI00131DC9D0|nr:DUF58 domain-containing protein [Methylocapsa sp. S129]